MTTRSASQRGSALVLALFMVVILSMLGLGLMMRTQLSQASAGAERTITKNFYAADSGIAAGFAHLQVNNPCPFQFQMTDERFGAHYPINIDVPRSQPVGPPQHAPGSEVGGSISGGGTNLVYYTYRLRSASREAATQTFRQIEAEMTIGPTTVYIPPDCT